MPPACLTAFLQNWRAAANTMGSCSTAGNTRCSHPTIAMKWWYFQCEELLVLEVKSNHPFQNWPFLLLQGRPSFPLMIPDQLYVVIDLSEWSVYCNFTRLVRELACPSLQRPDVFRMLVHLCSPQERYLEQITDFLSFIRPTAKRGLHINAVIWKLTFVFGLVGFCLPHWIPSAHNVSAPYKKFF